jgi:hypothetical protein
MHDKSLFSAWVTADQAQAKQKLSWNSYLAKENLTFVMRSALFQSPG